jgi:hypothetical protein
MIKYIFGEWEQVSTEEAIKYAEHLYWGMTIGNYDYRINHIEKHYIKGIDLRRELDNVENV